MPKMGDENDTEFVRMIGYGHSGTGKTGSLVSLIEAGYHIGLLDIDDGQAALRAQIRERCPTRQDQLSYVIPRRDDMKVTSSTIKPVVRGTTVRKAYTYEDAIRYLEEWDDGTKPYEWGPQHVLVIDTMTALGRAAFNLADKLNPTLKDGRQLYGLAQDSLITVLNEVCSGAFKAHVIIFAHIKKIEDGVKMRDFPTTVGEALSTNIGSFVNEVVLYQTIQKKDEEARRVIRTKPLPNADLKMSALHVEKEYRIEDGLAQIFEKITGVKSYDN